MPKEHSSFKMTRKRASWIGGRDTTLHGTPMRVNAASTNRAADEAQSMVYKMHLDVSSQVNNLFKTPTAKNSIAETPGEITTNDIAEDSFAMDASISSQSRILMNKLIDKWQKRFNIFGNDFAKKMIGTVDKQASNDLKRSTDKLSGGLNIKTDALTDRTKDIILSGTDESASLIKSIATDYTTEVKEAISRSISTNTGSFTSLKETINGMLQDKYKTYKNKSKNLALDQMKKAYGNIAASRMMDVGLDEYIWRKSGGAQQPNQYHAHVLDGNVYKLSEPPIIDPKSGTRGKPSDWYGCGCYMDPVITFG